MGKTSKALKYTQMDCQMFNSPEVRKSIHEYGSERAAELLAIIATVQMLIHGSDNGYFIDVKDLEIVISDITFIPCERINTAIEVLVAHGLYDKRLFKERNILTSAEIQTGYFGAASKMRRTRPADNGCILVDLSCYSWIDKPKNNSEKTPHITEKTIHFSEKPSNFSEKSSNVSENSTNVSEKSMQFSENPTDVSEKPDSNSISNSICISNKEKQDIELVLHSEKGLVAWKHAAEALIDNRQAVGWTTSGGAVIQNKASYARQWSVSGADFNAGSIFDSALARDAYKAIYDIVKMSSNAHNLTSIVKVVKKGEVISVHTTSPKLVKALFIEYKDSIKIALNKFNIKRTIIHGSEE